MTERYKQPLSTFNLCYGRSPWPAGRILGCVSLISQIRLKTSKADNSGLLKEHVKLKAQITSARRELVQLQATCDRIIKNFEAAESSRQAAMTKPPLRRRVRETLTQLEGQIRIWNEIITAPVRRVIVATVRNISATVLWLRARTAKLLVSLSEALDPDAKHVGPAVAEAPAVSVETTDQAALENINEVGEGFNAIMLPADRIVPRIIHSIAKVGIQPYTIKPFHIYVLDEVAKTTTFLRMVNAASGAPPYNKIRVVGLDCETANRESNAGPPSIIQIAFADNLVAIFHVFRMCQNESGRFDPALFPQLLKNLIESEVIFKTGVGISSDLARLEKHYGIRMSSTNFADTARIATAVAHSGPAPSLSTLTARYCGEFLTKTKPSGQWDLAPKEMHRLAVLYAAHDARASLKVFKHMFGNGPGKIACDAESSERICLSDDTLAKALTAIVTWHSVNQSKSPKPKDLSLERIQSFLTTGYDGWIKERPKVRASWAKYCIDRWLQRGVLVTKVSVKSAPSTWGRTGADPATSNYRAPLALNSTKAHAPSKDSNTVPGSTIREGRNAEPSVAPLASAKNGADLARSNQRVPATDVNAKDSSPRKDPIATTHSKDAASQTDHGDMDLGITGSHGPGCAGITAHSPHGELGDSSVKSSENGPVVNQSEIAGLPSDTNASTPAGESLHVSKAHSDPNSQPLNNVGLSVVEPASGEEPLIIKAHDQPSEAAGRLQLLQVHDLEVNLTNEQSNFYGRLVAASKAECAPATVSMSAGRIFSDGDNEKANYSEAPAPHNLPSSAGQHTVPSSVTLSVSRATEYFDLSIKHQRKKLGLLIQQQYLEQRWRADMTEEQMARLANAAATIAVRARLTLSAMAKSTPFANLISIPHLHGTDWDLNNLGGPLKGAKRAHWAFAVRLLHELRSTQGINQPFKAFQISMEETAFFRNLKTLRTADELAAATDEMTEILGRFPVENKDTNVSDSPLADPAMTGSTLAEVATTDKVAAATAATAKMQGLLRDELVKTNVSDSALADLAMTGFTPPEVATTDKLWTATAEMEGLLHDELVEINVLDSTLADPAITGSTLAEVATTDKLGAATAEMEAPLHDELVETSVSDAVLACLAITGPIPDEVPTTDELAAETAEMQGPFPSEVTTTDELATETVEVQGPFPTEVATTDELAAETAEVQEHFPAEVAKFNVLGDPAMTGSIPAEVARADVTGAVLVKASIPDPILDEGANAHLSGGVLTDAPQVGVQDWTPAEVALVTLPGIPLRPDEVAYDRVSLDDIAPVAAEPRDEGTTTELLNLVLESSATLDPVAAPGPSAESSVNFSAADSDELTAALYARVNELASQEPPNRMDSTSTEN
ncbi:hypothetical protein HDU86_007757 [Geranomyces michiganensis]|nr:hypothetical protein HDU86_007757 [Geranomyces michiganensis]